MRQLQLWASKALKIFTGSWKMNSTLEERVVHDFASLNSDIQKVSMGIKPSGKLHLGTAVTIYNAVRAAKRSNAQLDIQIMDLDFDQQRGTFFLPYKYYSDKDSCHESMRAHVEEEISVVLEEITGFLGAKIFPSVSYFSEASLTPQFFDMLMCLYKRGELKPLHANKVQSSSSLFAPVCTCNRSNTSAPKIDLDSRKLSTKCFFEQCDVEKYDVALDEKGRVNFHYLLDPLRDCVPDLHGRRADIHVFGGDYAQKYGHSRATKVERISQVARSAGHSMQFFVGPIVVADNCKVGKSMGEKLTCEVLRQNHGLSWIERLDYILSADRSGIIELNQWESYLV